MPPKPKPKKPTSAHSKLLKHLKDEQKKLKLEERKLHTEQVKVTKALKILGTSSHGHGSTSSGGSSSSSHGKKKKKTPTNSCPSGRSKSHCVATCTNCGPKKTIAKKERRD
jgi:hypothetical protein